MGTIEVEFFGIARQRANQPSAMISVDGSVQLADILRIIAERFPALVSDCIDDGKLSKICTANLNGDQFLSDAQSSIQPGDRLLIISADAGG